MTERHGQLSPFARTAIGVLILAMAQLPLEASAEWYVAPQFGINFADRLKSVRGTGSLDGLTAPSFDLQNSYAFGGKIGHYLGHQWFGLEVDVLHSTPHVKNLDDIPGIHLRVTNIGVHLLARYPGKTFQPYVGIGPAILLSRLSGSPTTQSDTSVTVGLNVLVGMRAFVTPYVAVFSEYKFTQGTPRYTDAFGADTGFHADYLVQQLVAGVSYHFKGEP